VKKAGSPVQRTPRYRLTAVRRFLNESAFLTLQTKIMNKNETVAVSAKALIYLKIARIMKLPKVGLRKELR
jgi:hypothetical protein